MSEHATGQFRLRSTVVPVSQRPGVGTSRTSAKRKSGHSEQGEVDAGDDDDVSRRRPPADDGGGGGDSSSSSSDDDGGERKDDDRRREG